MEDNKTNTSGDGLSRHTSGHHLVNNKLILYSNNN